MEIILTKQVRYITYITTPFIILTPVNITMIRHFHCTLLCAFLYSVYLRIFSVSKVVMQSRSNKKPYHNCLKNL